MRAQGQIELLDTKGPPLGIVEDEGFTYGQKSLQLLPGDRLHLFTDGITEQMGPNRKQFGTDRLQQAYQGGQGVSLALAQQQVLDELNLFKQNERIEDDVSLLSLQYGAFVT